MKNLMHLLNSLVRKSLLFLFFLLLLCFQKQHTEPQGLRTDLMRNADYVGQNGFKREDFDPSFIVVKYQSSSKE